MDQNAHQHSGTGQEQVIVAAPTRSDGVGRALRSAFRGRLDKTPPDFARLLEKMS